MVQRRTQQGFTMIELMMVVAIIGLLASVAIPSYQDYTVRARVAEGLSLASAAKMNVSDVLTGGNPSGASAGYAHGYTSPPATRNTSGVTIEATTGIITIQTSAAAGNGTLTLGPQVGGAGLPTGTAAFAPPEGALRWRCAASGAAALSPGQSAGTLLARFAPSECR